LATEDGLLERHLQKMLEIALVAPADSEYAEQIAKNAPDGDLADVDPPPCKRTARRKRRARFLGSMPESVVHGSPTLVGQHLVREVDLLEPFVGRRVPRMQVGVALAHELFERALDLLGRGISSHSEDLVVVPLLHAGPGGSSTRAIHRLAPLLAILWVGACKTGTYDPTDTATSPQAQAEPTPLAVSPVPSASTLALAAADAGPAPESLRFDSHLPSDTVRDPTREPGARESPREVKEVEGFALQAVFRSGEAPPPRAGEVNLPAIEAGRRKTEPRLTVEAGASRARFVLNGGFVLPPGTELRSRSDRYGHLLLWPGDDTVRVVQPGALRALLGERRLDIAPLSPADARSNGDGPHRFNLRTRRVEISTRAAKATLEVAAVHDVGEGGILVCRFLLDLMSATPSTRACGVDEVPLHAELRWTTGGVLVFDASSLVQPEDISVQDLAVPPPAYAWVTAPLPFDAAETLLPKAEIAAFHSAPVDLPSRPQRDGQAPLPDTGLALVNSSDELRIAWLEGVPIAWVGPGARLDIATLLHGRYSVQWRTFLGDAWEPVDLVVAPGTSTLR
jgi:hypothetical protein